MHKPPRRLRRGGLCLAHARDKVAGSPWISHSDSFEGDSGMPGINSVHSTQPVHVPIHEAMISQCPHLTATRPTDVLFSDACVTMAHTVPENRRDEVIAAFKLGIEAQKGKTSDGARAIMTNLRAATVRIKKTLYAKKDVDTGVAAHPGNGAGTHDMPSADYGRSEGQHAT